VRYNASGGAGLAPTRLVPRPVPMVDPWTAGEMFISPHVEERRRGLALLCGAEAVRKSSLTVHLLASRVDEPDLGLRAQIVHALADYFEVRERDYRYPPEVRSLVAGNLRRFAQPQVVALLELHQAASIGRVPLRPDSLLRLIERIPSASALLTHLAGDRGQPLPVRRSALELIGQVGFTDAGAVLEGLLLRLEGRRAGQMPMLFAPSDWPEDQALLPALRETLVMLAADE
jgi:hypothetical protein